MLAKQSFLIDEFLARELREGRPVHAAEGFVVTPTFVPDLVHASLDLLISTEVASDLITKVAGKRLAITIGRRVPVVGGVVGMGADGYLTWRIGRYADREFLPRAAR